MVGEHNRTPFTSIIGFFRKWYPIPSGIFIGFGLIAAIPIAIWSFSYTFDAAAREFRFTILVSSLVIFFGWAAGFASPRRNALAMTFKTLGIGFVLLGFIIFLGSFWTPDPNDVGDFAGWNPMICLAWVFIIFIAPIAYAVFWSGVVVDSLPELKRMRHILLALASLLIPLAAFFMLVIMPIPIALFLFCGLYGFHSVALGISIFKRRRKAEKYNEFDSRLITEVNERVMLEKLDETGFKG